MFHQDLYLRRCIGIFIVAAVTVYSAVTVLDASTSLWFEIAQDALDLTVRSTFATSYAAIGRDLIVVLYVGLSILRREGRRGVNRWISNGKDAAAAVALAFLVTFVYHAFESVPDRIRTFASAKLPRPRMPDVPYRALDRAVHDSLQSGSLRTDHLPPFVSGDQFLTHIIVTPGNMVQCVMNMNLTRATACVDLRGAAKGRIRRPDTVESLSEVLQHYLAALVWLAGNGDYSGSSTNGRMPQVLMAPIDPPEYQRFVPRPLLGEPFESALYPVWFPVDQQRMKLPKGTRLTFTNEHSDEHRNPYILRLEREGFYRLDLSVYGFGAPQVGQIPNGYEVSEYVNVPQLTTYTFVVRFDWILQRTHPDSFVVEDYDHWARALLGNISQKLAN